MVEYNVNQVYTVSDLKTVNQFGLFERNRDINENHVNEIIKAIKAGKKMPPIEVELRTLKAVDGQHRLVAARRIMEEGGQVSLDVVFRDFNGDEDAAMDYAHDINAHQKSWTDKNYLAYYKPVIDSYRKLEEFAASHTLCHSVAKSGKNKGNKNLKLTTAARLVMGPNFQRSAIRLGNFNATDEDFADAAAYHDELKKILTLTGYVSEDKNCPNMGNSFESMISGWINFRSKQYRKMEQIGGFDSYCKRVPKGLDMSVFTTVKGWYDRFDSLI